MRFILKAMCLALTFETHNLFQLWDLKFDFPYYGHIVSSLAVTTGGNERLRLSTIMLLSVFI